MFTPAHQGLFLGIHSANTLFVAIAGLAMWRENSGGQVPPVIPSHFCSIQLSKVRLQ